jgi:hypothetical protein
MHNLTLLEGSFFTFTTDNVIISETEHCQQQQDDTRKRETSSRMTYCLTMSERLLPHHNATIASYCGGQFLIHGSI